MRQQLAPRRPRRGPVAASHGVVDLRRTRRRDAVIERAGGGLSESSVPEPLSQRSPINSGRVSASAAMDEEAIVECGGSAHRFWMTAM